MSLPVVSEPISVLHCRSRDVHWPEAQLRPAPPAPQPEPSGALALGGQLAEAPEQVSTGSHEPVLGRHTVPLAARPHWRVQHSSLEKSQTEPAVNLQVAALQHGLPAQPWAPPQSQSSPASTMPLPHWLPVMVTTSLLLVRHVDLTLLRPMAEQMLPTLQGENLVMPLPVEGFMMNWPPASHEAVLSGQHCWRTAVPSPQVDGVQSCTAPKVWPDSCANTCHSVDVRTTTLAAATVSLASPDEPCTQAMPSQARPTAASVLQVLSRVQ